jgi:hypothetical protein
VQAGLRDVTILKEKFDKILLAKDYGKILFARFELDRHPDIMVSGGCAPEFDFCGRELQNLGHLQHLQEIILFSLFTSGGRGHFCFIWHEEHDKTCRQFSDSLIALTQDQRAHAIVRFVFEYSDNVYMNPDWWDARSAIEKRALIARVGAPILVSRSKKCLCDDGMRVVDWRVENVESG